MGRNPSFPYDQHFGPARDTGKSRKERECTYCEAARACDGGGPAKLYANRKRTLIKHLSECTHAPSVVRETFGNLKGARNEISHREGSLTEDEDATQAPALKKPRQQVWQTMMFITLLVQFQHDNLLPDTFIERESTQRFFGYLCPGIQLPKRRRLGCEWLRHEASRLEKQEQDALRVVQRTSGGWVNVLSDVWKNIAKTHLLCSQLILFSKKVVLGVERVGDKHDGVATAHQLNKMIVDARDAGFNIGACVTDDASQCANARAILSLRYPNIVFMKCFAHDVNNLVKAVLRADTTFKDIATKASAAVHFLNNSTSKWYPRAQKYMRRTYEDQWGFITLCETRWNSMQGCFASLLRVKHGLRSFHTHCSRTYAAEFPDVLQVLGDDTFWEKLVIAELVIRPLAAASLRLQRDQNTMAEVVISFKEILNGFRHALMDEDVLVACVEKRWAACEQPLFLLALFLHPAYRSTALSLLESGGLRRSQVTDFAVFYYRLLVGADSRGIRDEMETYLEGTLTTASFDQWKGRDAIWRFWRHVEDEHQTADDFGDDTIKLPRLAIRVLSIAVNTATCERLFSDYAAIHTSVRNRLHVRKVKYIQIIRDETRRQSSSRVVREFENKIIDASEKPFKKTPRKSRTLRPHDDTRDMLVVANPCASESVGSDDDDDEMFNTTAQPDEIDDMLNESTASQPIAFLEELLDDLYGEELAEANEGTDDSEDDDSLEARLAVPGPEVLNGRRKRIDAENEAIPQPDLSSIKVLARTLKTLRRRKRNNSDAVPSVRDWKISLSSLFRCKGSN